MTEELVEEGIVLDSGNGIVEIQLKENENCEECSAKLFCSTGNGNSKTLKINNNSNFEPGDKVTISISGKNLIIASLNLYFFPILILVISIFLG